RRCERRERPGKAGTGRDGRRKVNRQNLPSLRAIPEPGKPSCPIKHVPRTEFNPTTQPACMVAGGVAKECPWLAGPVRPVVSPPPPASPLPVSGVAPSRRTAPEPARQALPVCACPHAATGKAPGPSGPRPDVPPHSGRGGTSCKEWSACHDQESLHHRPG